MWRHLELSGSLAAEPVWVGVLELAHRHHVALAVYRIRDLGGVHRGPIGLHLGLEAFRPHQCQRAFDLLLLHQVASHVAFHLVGKVVHVVQRHVARGVGVVQ